MARSTFHDAPTSAADDIMAGVVSVLLCGSRVWSSTTSARNLAVRTVTMVALVAHDPVPVTVQPDGLKGLLGVPRAAKGVVIFAHGSGSGRLSPRNYHVARGLRDAGLGTLLIDLLTPAEEQHRSSAFDIMLLASRLTSTTKWVGLLSELAALPIGYLGASTGADAALLAASRAGERSLRSVSRGGRPDLAGPAALARGRAPTLLIVGSRDTQVIELERPCGIFTPKASS